MATYQLTSPDGQKYRVTAPEGASEEEVLNYFKQNQSPAKTERSGNIIADVGSQFAQGALAGFGDEATAFVADKFYGVPYDEALGMQRSYNEGFEKENPLSSAGLQLAGGLAGSYVGAKGLQAAAPQAATALASYGATKPIEAGARTGALSGAAYGFGQGEGGLEDRVSSAAQGATIGAATGAIGGKIAKEIGKKTGKVVPNAEDIRASANEAYKRADKAGGILRTQFTDNFVNEIQGLKPQTPAGKLLSGDDEFSKIVDRLSGLKGKPISLSEAQEIDEFLGTAVDGFVQTNGKLSKQGKKIFDVQTKFRNMIEGASASDIVGAKRGFDALKEGRKLWSQSLKLGDVERIINRAEQMDQPANAIRSGFRTLLNNPARMRGFSEAERKAIKKAADEGIVTGILRPFSSRLVPIISTGTGDVSGAVLSNIGSMAARGTAAAYQANKAAQVANIIANKGVLPEVASPLAAYGLSLGGSNLSNNKALLDYGSD